MGFGVWGLGFGVWGLGFGVWGLRFTKAATLNSFLALSKSLVETSAPPVYMWTLPRLQGCV